jgi:fumarylacetoacetate (FAA) hydrolase
VAATPDELEESWNGARLDLRLLSTLNGRPFGRPRAGVDMTFDFPSLIAHAARTRPLAAGSIIGSGTVSNKGSDGGPGKPISEDGDGYSCIAELRMVETIRDGQPTTPFMRFGDRIRIEMLDAAGRSIFGAIDQVVERHGT